MTVGNGTQLFIGTNGGIGSFVQDGAGSRVSIDTGTNGFAFGWSDTVGVAGGQGSYDLRAGTFEVLSSRGVSFGTETDGTGDLIQSGGTFTATGPVVIGLNGNGTYALSGGSSTLNGGLTIAQVSGRGEVNQTGGSLTVNGNIAFGVSTGTGIYTLAGGTLSTRGITGGNANSEFIFAGGTLIAGTSFTTSANFRTILNSTATIQVNGVDTVTWASALSGAGGLVKTGAGTLTLSGNNGSYSGDTTVNAGTLRLSGIGTLGNGAGATTVAGGTLNLGSTTQVQNGGVTLTSGTIENGTLSSSAGFSLAAGTISATLIGSGAVAKSGAGIVVLSGANGYTGGTMVQGGLIGFASGSNFGTGLITLNGGGLQWAAASTADISSRLAPLGVGGGTFDTNGNSVTLGTAVTGTGALTKAGSGTLTLSGANSFAGGTVVNAGVLQLANGASLPAGGALTINGGIFNLGSGNLSFSSLSGSGGALAMAGGTLTYDSTAASTFGTAITGNGTLAVQGGGALTLTGASTFSGTTSVTGSRLVVNGSLASLVTLDGTSTIGGNGTIGGLVSSGGTISPGNSIGTLNVNGTFAQTGGTYLVEANAQGQSDRIAVTGAASLNGGTVQVVAASGTYATSTTYTILTATGGVSGAYASVSSNFAFLTPSLTYNANAVLLTLALQGDTPFSTPFAGFSGTTSNQLAVARALDRSYGGATGDYAIVIGALANLSLVEAAPTLNQISGQPIANFGTANVANASLFMNVLGQQMALARGGAGTGQRVALAEACEVASCDGTSPFSVWGSLLGGVGSVQGNGNASTFTYNLGGAAAGIDYRLSPSVLVGLGTGYTTGTQWVDSFMGKAWSNSLSVAAYGSFTPSGALANLYLDALAGYAYSNNQLQRQIQVPGLQPRQASGSAGANQFLGQVETGYRIGVYAPAAATVTPFARFQAASINQAAFDEWGASSLSLNVAQQTTTSLRTTLGAELTGALGSVTLGLRLGWLHEYADTSRPMTAAFAGSPAAGFTVYGATPQRDSAVIGLQAGTRIADNASIFLRYDGELSSGTDNHALNVGVRLSW